MTSLPASLATLEKLEKLDIRWNQLSTHPSWVGMLEQRGCIVYT
ncbi:MAG: hypothetical protein HY276_10550 [Ignavibacteriales bacterium]|nr:hypothetical protein [Ignavibacteriales bacterium]